MNKRPALKKQYLVVFILSELVKQLFDCPLVPQNNVGEQAKYPFVTYSFTDPHQDTTADHRSDQMIVTMLFDCHTQDYFKANEMAETLRDTLVSSDGYRRYFTQADVVPQEPAGGSDIGDHTAQLFGYRYDNAVGFYYAFLVSHADTTVDEKSLNFTFDESIIESVKANSLIDDDSINASKF